MRFREFGRDIGEGIPAVTARDLKSVGPNVLQATKNLTAKLSDKISAAIGQKTPADKTATVAPTLDKQIQPQASAIQQAQLQATDKSKKPPEIPNVGSQLVLPDKDLKRPGSYVIGAQKGNDITLKPVKTNPNEPRVDVTVKKMDLQKALSTINPQSTTKPTGTK